MPDSERPWEEPPAEAPPHATEADEAELVDQAMREFYPSLDAAERETYGSFSELYGELRRPPPRRR